MYKHLLLNKPNLSEIFSFFNPSFSCVILFSLYIAWSMMIKCSVKNLKCEILKMTRLEYYFFNLEIVTCYVIILFFINYLYFRWFKDMIPHFQKNLVKYPLLFLVFVWKWTAAWEWSRGFPEIETINKKSISVSCYNKFWLFHESFQLTKKEFVTNTVLVWILHLSTEAESMLWARIADLALKENKYNYKVHG